MCIRDRLQAVDVLLLDTAGRLHVDAALMEEMKAVAAISRPKETLLVVDSLTGQDAVNVAQSFAGEVDLTGVIVTRMDGDARGGAALSMRAVTGKPIKFEMCIRDRSRTRRWKTRSPRYPRASFSTR